MEPYKILLEETLKAGAGSFFNVSASHGARRLFLKDRQTEEGPEGPYKALKRLIRALRGL